MISITIMKTSLRQHLSLSSETALQPLPLIILLVVITVYHTLLFHTGLFSDDKLTLYAIYRHGMWEELYERFTTFSSRLSGDTLLAIFVQTPYMVFLLLNIGVWIGLYWLLVQMLRLKSNMLQTLAALSLLSVPFIYTITSGVIATSINYLWTFTGLLYLIYVERRYRCANIPLVCYPLMAFCLFNVCLFQLSVVLLIGYTLYMLATQRLLHKSWGSRTMIVYAVTAVAGLAVVLSLPNVEGRLSFEIERYNPLFATYGVMEKAVLGFYRTAQLTTGYVNGVYIALCAALALTVRSDMGWGRRIIRLLPIGILTASYALWITGVLSYKQYFLAADEPLLQVVLGIVIFLLSALSVAVALYDHEMNQPTGSLKRYITLMAMLCSSCATLVALGFAPSLYHSTGRVSIYFMGALLIVFLYVSRSVFAAQSVRNRVITGILCAVTTLTVAYSLSGLLMTYLSRIGKYYQVLEFLAPLFSSIG